MPIYEYECPVCGRFEHIQLGSEPDLTRCPKDNGACPLHADKGSVRRVISAAAFHLKGGGWYKTDYASSASSSNSSSSSSSSSTSAESAAGSTGGDSGGATSSSGSSDSSSSGTKGSCGSSCACH
jgi:putative FmdB family regulatory protein